LLRRRFKKPQAAALKAEANAAFSAKEFEKASELYTKVSLRFFSHSPHSTKRPTERISRVIVLACWTKAIELDPSNHVLYSNRSASKSSLKDYQGALDDAEKVSFFYV
jgi:stress-induced-phosphoprotein 1